MSLDRPSDQDIVIVGATGDLARRKLLPALYNLHLDGLLPEKGKIIGYGRSASDDAAFRKMARAAVQEFSRRPLVAAKWAAFSHPQFWHDVRIAHPLTITNQRVAR